MIDFCLIQISTNTYIDWTQSPAVSVQLQRAAHLSNVSQFENLGFEPAAPCILYSAEFLLSS